MCAMYTHMLLRALVTYLRCALCLHMHCKDEGRWDACRTRAKQEADAAAELQKDLARIEELSVEIR